MSTTQAAQGGLDGAGNDCIGPSSPRRHSGVGATNAIVPEPAAKRLAYADPPYLGCSRYYRDHPDAKRWDDPAEHGALMARMEATYDGWALSAGMNSLQALLPLAPQGVRVAAWVKPFSAAFPAVRIAYAWEPVIYRPARPLTREGAASVKDFLVENMAMRRGLVGAKPEKFCRWVLDLLGYLDGDTVDDLFPGTGVMSAVLAQGVLVP